MAVFLFTSLQLCALYSNGQDAHKEYEPEISWGIKVVTRQIQYGRNDLYVTQPASIGLQPVVRYDSPIKIAATRYIDLVGQAGFLFCKANVFDTSYRDPATNIYTHYHSRNPTYLPLYFGVYNMSAVSVGAEIFFWKGLGTRDIWGIKFLSLGYKAKHFRIDVAGELYAQVRNHKNAGTLLSFDFFWKLIKDDR